MGASLGTLPPLGFCTCCSLAWSTLLIALSVAPLLLVLRSVPAPQLGLSTLSQTLSQTPSQFHYCYFLYFVMICSFVCYLSQCFKKARVLSRSLLQSPVTRIVPGTWYVFNKYLLEYSLIFVG